MQGKTFTVCVTGAAGQIAYSFLPQLCKGAVFPGVSIHLRLLDITPALNVMKGVAMELEDCSYTLLKSVTYGDKSDVQFKDADIIVFIGGMPRKQGMQRKDLLSINKKIFVEQSKSLKFANPDVKCVVVANPANTNTAILSHFASTVKRQNITCLTRLDHNRAVAQLVGKTGAKEQELEGVYIFGNHSLTQYPCINNLKVKGKPISDFADKEWLTKTYIPKVQKRGGQILAVRGGSSVFSAANAVIDHLRDWYLGHPRVTSMGVVSEGDYNIPKGLWTSLPVICKGNFKYEIVRNVPLSQFCKSKIAETVKQLEQQYYFYFNEK